MDPADTRAAPRRWLLLALLMSQAAMVHFNRVSISVAGTELFIPEYGLTKTQMGAVYTAYLVAYTLLMLPGGWLIDAWGPRRALLWMGIGSCVLVPLTGLAGWIFGWSLLASLLVIRSLLGSVTPPMHPGAARAVSLWFPVGQRGWANGMVTATAVLGVVVSPVLFGWLMDAVGWRWAFGVAGIATALVTLAWALLARDPPAAAVHGAEVGDPSAAGPSAAMGWRELLGHRPLVLLTLGYAAYSYFQYLFFYWAEDYFLHELGMPKAHARWATSATLLAMTVGMLVGGVLTDWTRRHWPGRWGRIAVPIAGMAASAVFVVLAVAEVGRGVAVACFALSMATLGMSEAAFWVTGVELGRRWGGTTGALLNTVGNAGGLVAPIVTPLFADQMGWHWGLRLAGGLCLLGGLCWLGVAADDRSPQAAAST